MKIRFSKLSSLFLENFRISLILEQRVKAATIDEEH